jgi:hypothetical protein
MIIPFLMATVLLVQQNLTEANVNKGSSLFASCQAHIRVMDRTYKNLDEDFPASEYCVGYVEGFTTGNVYGGGSLCFKEASAGTLVRVYVAYMQRNPKLLDDDKYVGLGLALRDSYQCKAKK